MMNVMEGSSLTVFGEGREARGADQVKPWKASEELALLEAVELYGFGNWEDTAKLVGTRNATEVREHFITYFVRGNVGRVCWSHASPETYTATDHTCPGATSTASSLSPSLTTPLQPIPELSVLQQQHLGYMPKRDDFEREFDNEVEYLISNLRINPHDEDDLDVDLKVAHIDMYNRRLRERFRKKAVVRDYGLVSLFYKSLEKDEEVMALLNPALYPHLQSLSPASSSSSPSSSSMIPDSRFPTSSSTSLVGSSSNLLHSQSSSFSSGPNQTRLQSNSMTTSPASPSRNSSSSTPVSSPGNGKARQPSSPLSKINLLSPSSCLLTGKSKKKSQSNSPLSPEKNDNEKNTTNSITSSLPERFREQMREKIKILSQFQTALDQQNLLDSLKREKELKVRIKELVRCRKNGLKKLSEIPAFYSVRLTRDKKKENKKKVGNTVCGLKDPAKDSPMEREREKGVKTRNSKESHQLSSMEREADRRSPTSSMEGSLQTAKSSSNNYTKSMENVMESGNQVTSMERSRRSPLSSNLKHKSKMTSSPTSPQSASRTTTTTGFRGSPLLGQDFNSCNSNPSGPARKRRKSDEESTKSLDQKAMDQIDDYKGLKEFDINSMPSARLLSDQEKRLCTSLRLTPSQYISIKGLMIKESSQGKKQKTGLENIDARIRRRLANFLKRNGWIKSDKI